uniref:Secreted protein n=1 Tax=Ixodes ricinus TaxID=34613 RepID=A0A6B0VCH7_IXORI
MCFTACTKCSLLLVLSKELINLSLVQGGSCHLVVVHGGVQGIRDDLVPHGLGLFGVLFERSPREKRRGIRALPEVRQGLGQLRHGPREQVCLPPAAVAVGLGTADQRECNHVHVLLALVLEQLGLAGILLVAQTAVMRLRGHAAHHVREGRVGLSRDAGHATLDTVAHGQGSAGVVLDDVRLAFGRGPVHLLAVLAVVVPGGPQDREVQLWHRVWPHIGVPLGQVVHQHAPPLEAQEASVALVDEPVVVCRRHLWHKALCGHWPDSLGPGRFPSFPVGPVQPPHVLLELVLALELLPAQGAQELPVFRVAQHVQLELVLPREHLWALWAREALVRVEGTDVLPHLVVLQELFLTRGTGVHSIFIVRVYMVLEGSDHMKLLLADGALKKSLPIAVRPEVSGEGGVVEEALVAQVALEGLGVLVAVHLQVLGKPLVGGKALVAQAAFVQPRQRVRRGRHLLAVSPGGPTLAVDAHVLHQLCPRQETRTTLGALLESCLGIAPLLVCRNHGSRVDGHVDVQHLDGVEHEAAVGAGPERRLHQHGWVSPVAPVPRSGHQGRACGRSLLLLRLLLRLLLLF